MTPFLPFTSNSCLNFAVQRQALPRRLLVARADRGVTAVSGGAAALVEEPADDLRGVPGIEVRVLRRRACQVARIWASRAGLGRPALDCERSVMNAQCWPSSVTETRS